MSNRMCQTAADTNQRWPAWAGRFCRTTAKPVGTFTAFRKNRVGMLPGIRDPARVQATTRRPQQAA